MLRFRVEEDRLRRLIGLLALGAQLLLGVAPHVEAGPTLTRQAAFTAGPADFSGAELLCPVCIAQAAAATVAAPSGLLTFVLRSQPVSGEPVVAPRSDARYSLRPRGPPTLV